MEYTTFIKDYCPCDLCSSVCKNCGLNYEVAGEGLCHECLRLFKQDEIREAVKEN